MAFTRAAVRSLLENPSKHFRQFGFVYIWCEGAGRLDDLYLPEVCTPLPRLPQSQHLLPWLLALPPDLSLVLSPR
jgi:hypothetical protein